MSVCRSVIEQVSMGLTEHRAVKTCWGACCLHLHCVVIQCSDVIGYQRFGGPCCLHLHCVVMPCSVVVGYQRFGGPCCLHLQGEVVKV